MHQDLSVGQTWQSASASQALAEQESQAVDEDLRPRGGWGGGGGGGFYPVASGLAALGAQLGVGGGQVQGLARRGGQQHTAVFLALPHP